VRRMFPELITKTEDVLTHTLTEGTQDDANGLSDVAVPCFESLLVGQDLSLRGRCSHYEVRLYFSLNHSRRWCRSHRMEVCLVLPVADIVDVTNEECSCEISLPAVVVLHP